MKKLLDIFLNSLYPAKSKCCICNLFEQHPVCEACLGTIKFINGYTCTKCGKALNDKYAKGICPNCGSIPHRFDRSYSCFEYEGTGKAVIHKLKYEGVRTVAKLLAKYMKEMILDQGLEFDIIVPVPLHTRKRAERGFNQAELIARELSKITGIQVSEGLIRVKETESQYNLSKNERLNNIAGAFSWDLGYNNSNYKKALLIDDVYTTGSTADECSAVLKNNGFSKVYIMTAASGRNT